MNNVEFFHNNKWKKLSIEIVGMGSEDIDVAVLAPSQKLAPVLPLEPTLQDAMIGQQVYFLGFPMGMVNNTGRELNRNFPVPLAKSGILSGAEKPKKIWIDGHNNPGFSGGPLVFVPHGKPNIGYRVAGVISGYRMSSIPVYNSNSQQIGIFPENSGIVEAYNIMFAIDLIENNPIGFPLSTP